jgi:uncharacterized membrane protein YphA (DoxX/SURF4 family)
MKKATIIEIISISFIILFLYTGISKLMEYAVFKEQIANSPILKPIASRIAWMLPLSEFIAAILLFVPALRLKGLYMSLIMMILFTGYVIAILNFSKELPCSCGGIIALLSWKQHLILNSLFVALAITGIIVQKGLQKLNGQSVLA